MSFFKRSRKFQVDRETTNRHYPSHNGMRPKCFPKASGGRHDPEGPEASAWSVTGTDQLPEDNGRVEIFGTRRGSADFNASGSCRPPKGLGVAAYQLSVNTLRLEC